MFLYAKKTSLRVAYRPKARIRCLFAIVIMLVASLSGTSLFAQDKKVVTLGATVVGNQEHPKVLYIVPWQQAEDNSILYQPLSSHLKSVFSHVERTEHQRQVEFLEELHVVE